MTPQSTQQLLEERGLEYGDAWRLTGAIIGTCIRVPTIKDVRPFENLMRSGRGYAWIEMLGKIVRAMFNPDSLDNWKDIAGYAELVVREMEGPTEPSTDDVPF